jgi:hypothetical protein
MSSTRDKNCQGNYNLEQIQNTHISEYSTYKYSAYGHPVESHYAGNGLIMGKMAPTNLSNNACDIESYLYGIGSSNLVNLKPPVVPYIKPLLSLSVIDRLPLIIPDPLVVAKNQRPYPMN